MGNGLRIDIEQIKARVGRALELAGPQPYVVGYDANGIQELITASNRPIAMLGASATIADFDRAKLAKGAIFAGGGRGVELVNSKRVAEERAEEIAAAFRRQTWAGVMATAYVPYDRAAPAHSLRWLRQKLDTAKDAAPPPRGVIPTAKHEHCADCNTYRATRPSRRRDAQGEMVCERCDAMVGAGRDRSHTIAERIQSLVDLSPRTGRIAAVSVDGNNLGAFFERLDSLEQMATASEAIAAIFKEAHAEALQKLHGDKVSLATGGDDIRLFLGPEDMFDYVGALVPAIEQRAAVLAARGGMFDGFAALGVGIGAVVADARLPASRLMDLAHELERNAKRLCRPMDGGPNGSPPVRSAFDFAVLTAGEASFGSIERSADNDGRPIAMAQENWDHVRALAAALSRVPRAQLAVLAEARPPTTAEEFENRFRYQIARSKAWQDWYDGAGVDWRDARALMEHRPRQVHIDILRAAAPSRSEPS